MKQAAIICRAAYLQRVSYPCDSDISHQANFSRAPRQFDILEPIPLSISKSDTVENVAMSVDSKDVRLCAKTCRRTGNNPAAVSGNTLNVTHRKPTSVVSANSIAHAPVCRDATNVQIPAEVCAGNSAKDLRGISHLRFYVAK
jgi:hypothetical protein